MVRLKELLKLSLSARRAWIENALPSIAGYFLGSLSARRAWIEKDTPPQEHKANTVALRKESVDRKDCHLIPSKGTFRSLSARRAWIENGKS